MQKPKRVVITHLGQWLKIDPATPVVGHFRTSRRVAGKAGQPLVAVAAKPEPLVKLQKSGKRFIGWCPAGLEELLIRAHEDAGIKVEIRGAALPVLPSPAPRRFDSSHCHDSIFLCQLQKRERLLIRHDAARVDVNDLIWQAVNAWPTCHFLIVVAIFQEAEQLFDRLGGRRNGVALDCYDDPFNGEWNPRIIICLPGNLGFVRMESFDLVMLPRANMVCWKNVPTIIDRAKQARLVGFLPRGMSLSPWEQDQLLQFFGLEPFVIPTHGMTERAVDVIQLRVAGGYQPPLDAKLLEVKRDGLWRQAVRNRRIGRLARQLVGDQVALAREHPSFGAALANKTDPGVLIVVETIDHALQIAKTLPGWRIHTSGDVCLDGISRSRRRLLQQCGDLGDGGAAQAIVTMTALPEMCLSCFDVLIRADGGVGGLPIDPRQLLETSPKITRRLLLVDFDDRHHPQLRKWSRSRINAYEQNGWPVFGSDPVDVAWRRFLSAPQRRLP